MSICPVWLNQVWLPDKAIALPGGCHVQRLATATSPTAIPLPTESVAAGFPSPAADYMDESLSLDELLIAHPAATFMVRVKGDSMQDANMGEGDYLVVDRSITPQSGDIVIAILDGALTVKRLKQEGARVYLVPENPAYPVIQMQEGQELVVWGVVTSTIRRFQRGSH
ncbi:LexA family protein [Chitinimonas sp. BJB300]|uniref:LexA family protein n=1 Tax=Chitinimonas sp. BJB300 TaxID=1559339 RepID=UPI000C116DB7|nr:translesion error-prone DNA polymerase V autoproteolytic subunit [Chitinimonas sp. BJB300]PHV09782.1 hypothetical protein CSQ89_19790 [Chitinimonas sp. BJB300]TSJ84637.1 translesion error-prone DNA polymerase V autoproteolytic subunit [Chitinimonas sp. BJB300]